MGQTSFSWVNMEHSASGKQTLAGQWQEFGRDSRTDDQWLSLLICFRPGQQSRILVFLPDPHLSLGPAGFLLFLALRRLRRARPATPEAAR